MKRTAKYWELLGRLDRVTPENYEERQTFMAVYMQIRRLAMRHHRLAEMDCNGEGYIRGQFYRCDGSTPGAYVSEDVTIFTAESDKIETKITKLAQSIGLSVDYQGDPRGYTVNLKRGNQTVGLYF